MARALNRLRKQVEGRRPGRPDGYVNTQERLLSVETAMLELLSYIISDLGPSGDDPRANNLVEAANDFKRTLEKVLAP